MFCVNLKFIKKMVKQTKNPPITQWTGKLFHIKHWPVGWSFFGTKDWSIRFSLLMKSRCIWFWIRILIKSSRYWYNDYFWTIYHSLLKHYIFLYPLCIFFFYTICTWKASKPISTLSKGDRKLSLLERL